MFMMMQDRPDEKGNSESKEAECGSRQKCNNAKGLNIEDDNLEKRNEIFLESLRFNKKSKVDEIMWRFNKEIRMWMKLCGMSTQEKKRHS